MGVRCARGNVYETVGEETAGGTCTCPDGLAYQVSATSKECTSLHCIGGTVSTACQNQSQADPRAAGMGVRCANSVAAFYSVDAEIEPRETIASSDYNARLGGKTVQKVVTDQLTADHHNYGVGEGGVLAAWVKIDLGPGSSEPVAALKLVGRNEGRPWQLDRSQDLTIRVGDTGSLNDALCREGVDISTHAVTTVPCAKPLSGRYVVIYRVVPKGVGKNTGDQHLDLRSAQVYSKAAPDCASPGRLDLCRRDNSGNLYGCTAFHQGWQNNSLGPSTWGLPTAATRTYLPCDLADCRAFCNQIAVDNHNLRSSCHRGCAMYSAFDGTTLERRIAAWDASKTVSPEPAQRATRAPYGVMRCRV